MESNELSELLPLFNTASPETLEWFLSIATEEEYGKDSIIITEGTWGRSVYFIISGWVKIQSLEEEKKVTLEILGREAFFGEIAILDEPLQFTEVISLSPVKLLTVSAQRFIQTLYKDPQLQHRMLQVMARRIRQLHNRFQIQYKSPKIKLTKLLLFWAENYGKITGQGVEIYNISCQDIADIADINIEESEVAIDKLQSNGWLEIDKKNHILRLTNLKQIAHLTGQI